MCATHKNEMNQFDVLSPCLFVPVPLRVPQSSAKISVHRLFYAQFYDLHLPVIKRGRPIRSVHLKMLFIMYHIRRVFGMHVFHPPEIFGSCSPSNEAVWWCMSQGFRLPWKKNDFIEISKHLATNHGSENNFIQLSQ